MILRDKVAKRTDAGRRDFLRGVVCQDVRAIASAQSRFRLTLLGAGIIAIIISDG